MVGGDRKFSAMYKVDPPIVPEGNRSLVEQLYALQQLCSAHYKMFLKESEPEHPPLLRDPQPEYKLKDHQALLNHFDEWGCKSKWHRTHLTRSEDLFLPQRRTATLTRIL